MRKLNRNKKASVEFLRLAILGLVIATITLSIGLTVNETLTSNIKLDDTTNVSDETITLINGTPVALDYNDIASIDAIFAVMNATNNYSLEYGAAPTGEYTYNAITGSITLTNSSHGGNTSYVNYTYYTDTSYKNASADGTTGLSTFADYWTIIAIVIVLAVIIGLFSIFAGSTGKGVEIR